MYMLVGTVLKIKCCSHKELYVVYMLTCKSLLSFKLQGSLFPLLYTDRQKLVSTYQIIKWTKLWSKEQLTVVAHVELTSPFSIWLYFQDFNESHLHTTTGEVQMMVFTRADCVVCPILILLWLGSHNKQVHQKNTLVSTRLVFSGCDACSDLALKKVGE